MKGWRVGSREFWLRSIAVVGLVAVAACTNQAGGASVTVEERKAIALRYADELWGRGNLQIIDELCTPDFFWADAVGDPMDIEAIKTYVQGREVSSPIKRLSTMSPSDKATGSRTGGPSVRPMPRRAHR